MAHACQVIKYPKFSGFHGVNNYARTAEQAREDYNGGGGVRF